MISENRKLRLSFISHEFPPIGGGASSALDAITRRLSQRGNIVQILTINLADKISKTIQEKDKFERNIVRFNAGRRKILAPSAWELLRSYMALRFSASSYLRAFAPDALTAFFAFPAGHAALALGNRLKIPIAVSLRGSDVPGFSDARWGLFRFIRVFLLQPVYKRADLLLANGNYLSCLAERFIPTRKVFNLPNGVDTNIYHPQTQPHLNGPLRILFVGQLIKRKRCLEMLEGLEWLSKQGISAELTIVGQGPLRPEIESFARHIEPRIQISLPGHIPRQKMPEIYRQHDVLILLSRAEGISNVLLEALASGLCIVASNAASTDVLKDKKAGIMIDPITPSTIGNALLRLARSHELKTQMQKAARRLSEGFDWDVTVASFEDHILKLLGEKRSLIVED